MRAEPISFIGKFSEPSTFSNVALIRHGQVVVAKYSERSSDTSRYLVQLWAGASESFVEKNDPEHE